MLFYRFILRLKKSFLHHAILKKRVPHNQTAPLPQDVILSEAKNPEFYCCFVCFLLDPSVVSLPQDDEGDTEKTAEW